MPGAEREQLVFDLPVRPAFGREDFFVAEANAMAVAQIDMWRAWPGSKFALVGPAGAGKTHLAHVWQEESDARIVAATALPQADIPDLADRPVCVEDVGAIAGDRKGESALFHLHNLVLAEGHALLMTAHVPPAQLGLQLPDLASRLMGTQFVRLSAPDDVLLGAVMGKLFHDRQLDPAPQVIPYLVRRMPRSFASARHLVEEIDRQALSRRSRVTLPLARETLSRLEPETDDD